MGLDLTLRTLSEASSPLAMEVARGAFDDPSSRVRIKAAEFFLRREDRRGIAAALSVFHDLPPRLQESICGDAQVLRGPLRDRAGDPDEQVRLNCIDAARRCGHADLYPFLTRATSDGSPTVRQAAVDAYVEIVGNLAAGAAKRAAAGAAQQGPAARALLKEIGTALNMYAQHRPLGLLVALVELGAIADEHLLVHLAAPDDPRGIDLLEVLRTRSTPGVVRLLLRMLREGNERIRHAATEVFRSREGAAWAIEVAKGLAALEDPQRAELARHSRQIPWWPTLLKGLAARKNPAAADAALQIVLDSQVDEELRMECAAEIFAYASTGGRLECLRTARAGSPPNARAVLLLGLDDDDPTVQFNAASWAASEPPADRKKLLTRLLQSPHTEVRRLAARELSHDSFERYVESFDKLDARTRELAGRAIAKIDENLTDRLSDELRSLDPERRVKALRIVGMTDKEKDLGPLLLELINDPDRAVRATVVKTIGLLGNIEAIKVLIRALSDPDRRTRANAVEAFEEIGIPKLGNLLLPFLRDPDNRVRANAAKALWNLGHTEAREVLEEMTRDPQELMRLSAVWTLGEIRYPGSREILANLARADDSEVIRSKAAGILESWKPDEGRATAES